MRVHEHASDNRHSASLLALSALLTAGIFFIELAGGLWTNSVALLSDAGHVLMDLTALLFSLFALRLAERPVTDRRTFGLHRLEVFAAFLNGALVTGVAIWILWESMGRLKAPPAVKTGPMVGVAILGLAVNLFVAWRLHGFARRDVNVRGAFLHVASDALASLGVVAGGIVIHFTGAVVLDPLVGIGVAVVIVVNAFRLLKESVDILLEGVPRNIVLAELVEAVESVPGVRAVEDTHVWTICSHIVSLSAHVVVSPEGMAAQKEVTDRINALLRERFHITHSTLQIQSSDWTP